MSGFLCGAEEPMLPNDQLDALDECTGEIELASFSIADVFRYSFVPRERSISSMLLPRLLELLVASGSSSATWVIVFRGDDEQGLDFRARVLSSKLRRAYWTLVARAGVTIATKPISAGGLGSVPPSELDERIAGWFVALGDWSSFESLLAPPFLESMKMLSVGHRLQPSKEFLMGAREARLGVAYVASASMDRQAVVVTAAHPLTSVVQQLCSAGEIFKDSSARNAWVRE